MALDGVDVSGEDYRAALGYLPQDFGYYPDFTGMDFLLYLAALKGLSRPCARRKAAELLELVSLADVGKKKIKTYSGGMKQRLGIAQAWIRLPGLQAADYLPNQVFNNGYAFCNVRRIGFFGVYFNNIEFAFLFYGIITVLLIALCWLGWRRNALGKC